MLNIYKYYFYYCYKYDYDDGKLEIYGRVQRMTPETVAESSKAGNTTRDVWLACAFPGTKLRFQTQLCVGRETILSVSWCSGAVGGECPVIRVLVLFASVNNATPLTSGFRAIADITGSMITLKKKLGISLVKISLPKF